MALFGNHLNCDSVNIHIDHRVVYDADDVYEIVDAYESKIDELNARIEELEDWIDEHKA